MLEPRRAAYLQLAILVIFVAALALSPRFFPATDLVLVLQKRVINLGAWSAVCYPMLFAACNVLLLPGGILSVGAGFLFGLWWGFFLVLVGNIIAAAVSFTIARSFGRQWFRDKLTQHPRLAALVPAVEEQGWKIVVLSQLHPLFPTSLVTYLYGLSRIRFRTYLLWVT